MKFHKTWSVILLLGIGAISANAQDACPTISASSYLVHELSTADEPCAKNADEVRPIASTTKLMTALLVVERMHLTDRVRVGEYSAGPEETVMGLRAGEQLSVADLLRGLLLASANDAAWTLAKGMSGSIRAFVSEMNEKARELGMTRTHFATPSGLSAKDRSSAHDLLKLAIAVRQQPFLRGVVSKSQLTTNTGAYRRDLINRNGLLVANPWITGIKTGHTQKAGWVLVGSSDRHGIDVLSVVMGAPSQAAREESTLQLLKWVSDRYEVVRPVRRGMGLGGVPISYRRGAELPLVAGASGKFVVRQGESAELGSVSVPSKVSGPIQRGEVVGSLEVKLGADRVAQIPLVAGADVPKAGVFEIGQDLLTRPLCLVILALTLLGAKVALSQRRSHRRSRGRRRDPRPQAT